MKYEIVELEYLSGKEATMMIKYSKAIMKQLDDRDLYFSPDGFELQGNFKNYDYE